MFQRLVLAAFLALAASSASAEATVYNIDPNHTQVTFGWNHFGFANLNARFDTQQSTFLFDPANPAASSVEVTIPIDSLNTGIANLREHLLSADFFDAATFPTASFKSTAVEAVGEGRLKMTGDLTIRDVTRQVVFDVSINKVGAHAMSGRAAAGFDAMTTIKRSEFGIGRYVPNVSDEIRIAISVEAVVPKPAE